MLEKGRLCYVRKDGTKDSVYINIKHKRVLFGSSEYSTIRIYLDGIFHKHCVLTFGNQGKAYLEPLHPSALTLVNGINIKHKICLEDNDVITILEKKFQFTYPTNSLSSNVSINRSIAILYSKQATLAQNFEIFALGRSSEIVHPFRECKVPNVNYIPKKLIYMIKSNIFTKIPELKFAHHESVSISYKNINAGKDYIFYSDKPLMKYINRYVEESTEARTSLALKLYEFFSFIKGLLYRNEKYIFDLSQILVSVSKYSIARAKEDILFLPLKYLYLDCLSKEGITVLKISRQSRILPHSENLSLNSGSISEKKSNAIKQKQNHHLTREISTSYKKRVSLAVKRYYLRHRKSIKTAKYVEVENDENFVSPGLKQESEKKLVDISVEEQSTFVKLTETKATKRSYKRKKRDAFTNETVLKKRMETKSTHGRSRKQTDTSESNEPKSEKASYRKKKEMSLEEFNSSQSIQKCDPQEALPCQRITRSMTKKRP